MTSYQKRHQYISPTMDFAAKKVFNLHEFTSRFISDILDLDVEDIEILEGSNGLGDRLRLQMRETRFLPLAPSSAISRRYSLCNSCRCESEAP